MSAIKLALNALKRLVATDEAHATLHAPDGDDVARMIDDFYNAKVVIEQLEAVQVEPIAIVVSSGPNANLPCLQWISADHSFRVAIGAKLYAAPQEAIAPAWIAVGERFPSNHDEVLVSNQAGITTGSYSKSLGWMWDELDDEPEDVFLSHWMPFPPAPGSAA